MHQPFKSFTPHNSLHLPYPASIVKVPSFASGGSVVYGGLGPVCVEGLRQVGSMGFSQNGPLFTGGCPLNVPQVSAGPSTE